MGELENKNAMKHGIASMDVGRGIRALEPFEMDNLQDLRALVKSGDGRAAVRDEIVARLVLICRKFFADSFNTHDSPRWWDSGPVTRGGTYLAELRRWLDSYPDDDKATVTLIEMLRGDDTGGKDDQTD
jgi:hypothetical protein